MRHFLMPHEIDLRLTPGRGQFLGAGADLGELVEAQIDREPAVAKIQDALRTKVRAFKDVIEDLKKAEPIKRDILCQILAVIERDRFQDIYETLRGEIPRAWQRESTNITLVTMPLGVTELTVLTRYFFKTNTLKRLGNRQDKHGHDIPRYGIMIDRDEQRGEMLVLVAEDSQSMTIHRLPIERKEPQLPDRITQGAA